MPTPFSNHQLYCRVIASTINCVGGKPEAGISRCMSGCNFIDFHSIHIEWYIRYTICMFWFTYIYIYCIHFSRCTQMPGNENHDIIYTHILHCRATHIYLHEYPYQLCIDSPFVSTVVAGLGCFALRGIYPGCLCWCILCQSLPQGRAPVRSGWFHCPSRCWIYSRSLTTIDFLLHGFFPRISWTTALQSKWPVQAIGSTDVHADAILLKPRKGPSSSRHEGMNLDQKTVLWCRGQGERMPLTLPAQEDILTSLPWWCFVQRRALRKSTHAFVHESGTAIAFDLSLGANFRPDMQILEVVRRSIQ